MLCELHKDALIEAAASGAMPQGELRAHLNACASCRAALAEEQSLFAAIDSGLHATANSEVPASLLPRVRAGLDEAAPRLRWVQPLIFASAGGALALVIFLMARPHPVMPQNIAKGSSDVAQTSVTPGVNANPAKIPPPNAQVASSLPSRPHSARNSTIPHSAASGNPEVLVPPDEREALARFVATLNEHSGAAATLLAHAPEKKDAVISVDPLQIPDIEIKPLESKETTTPDAAGEKR